MGAVGDIVVEQVAMLSMQKFSSNVIEKCMDRASEEVIVKYVRELADRDAMRRLLQVSSHLGGGEDVSGPPCLLAP